MSDTYICILPVIKEYPANKEKAPAIVKWLAERNIIRPELSDCILSKDLGYALADGAKQVVNEREYLPFGLLFSGLEVATEMTVFEPGGFHDEEADENDQVFESDPGFTFWNWPELKEQFVEEFKKQLGCEVKVIIGRI